MAKKLTLSMDEAVIEAAKKYVEKQGVSLSSYIESLLKNTTGTSSQKRKKQTSATPNVDEMTRILEEGRLSPEESKRMEEEYFKRKPYMREYVKLLEEKHGPIN
jgi:hypothetical protein